MEVKKGYKQTEVGVIPEDWDCLDAGTVIRFFGGNGFSSRAETKDGIRWLKIANVGIEKVKWEVVTYLPETFLDEFKEYVLKPNDVVMALTRPILGDKLKVARLTISDTPALLNQRVAKLIPKGDNKAEYLFYVVQQLKFITEMNNAMAGTDPPNIGNAALEKIAIAVPWSPEEQTAIAAVLSDADALISSLEKLIAKKSAIKQGAMQELLTGKRRLPGFSGKWEVKKLGEVSAIKTGKKNNEDKVEDGAYPFFVRSQTVERINTYSFDGEAILVPGEGGIGSIFHYINGRFDYHQRVYKISDFNAETCGKFIYFCMLQTFNKQATRNSVKATVDSLRLPTFIEFEFLAPPIEEQTAIAQVLSDMDAEIEQLEQKLNKYKMVKQGMMQELLTGKTRLI